jgi:hypothetical protein
MTVLDALPCPRTRGALALSRTPVDDAALYGRLLAAALPGGRCPVLLTDDALGAIEEGWDPRAALADVARRNAVEELSGRYPTGCVYHPDCLAPFGGTFPGTAPATAGRALLRPDDVPTAAAGEVDLLGEHLLGLVPVSRPADLPAAVGWFGTSSSWQPWNDVAALSAVLRSWEDRFGAVLVRMGRATLDLAVVAPPWERWECLAIAAEHYAFCDDTYTGNPGTLRDYANSLRGATRWSFRWDWPAASRRGVARVP